MGSSVVAPIHYLVPSVVDSMRVMHSAVLPMHPAVHPSAERPMDQAERLSAEKPTY